MLEIIKCKNSFNYDVFDICTDNGILRISYENNLDLYWQYLYFGNISNIEREKEFVISKENYFIYILFENLYNTIKNASKFNNNKDYKLFDNNKITWYSDDYADLDKASSIIIKKDNDIFIIKITKGMEDFENCNYFQTYSVRIRTSGSRYGEYYMPFMTMYESLKKYDANYRQVHIEEYLYQLKRKK